MLPLLDSDNDWLSIERQETLAARALQQQALKAKTKRKQVKAARKKNRR